MLVIKWAIKIFLKNIFIDFFPRASPLQYGRKCINPEWVTFPTWQQKIWIKICLLATAQQLDLQQIQFSDICKEFLPLLSEGAVTKSANIYFLSINKGQPLKLMLNGVKWAYWIPSSKHSLMAEVLGEDKESARKAVRRKAEDGCVYLLRNHCILPPSLCALTSWTVSQTYLTAFYVLSRWGAATHTSPLFWKLQEVSLAQQSTEEWALDV